MFKSLILSTIFIIFIVYLAIAKLYFFFSLKKKSVFIKTIFSINIIIYTQKNIKIFSFKKTKEIFYLNGLLTKN